MVKRKHNSALALLLIVLGLNVVPGTSSSSRISRRSFSSNLWGQQPRRPKGGNGDVLISTLGEDMILSKGGDTYYAHYNNDKKVVTTRLLAEKVQLARIQIGCDTRSLSIRGGDQEIEMTLDQKVHAAMRKLGLTPPGEEFNVADMVRPPPPPPKPTEITAATTTELPTDVVCEDGVCQLSTERQLRKTDISPQKDSQNGVTESATTVAPPPPSIPPPRPPPLETEQITKASDEIQVVDEIDQGENREEEGGETFFDTVNEKIFQKLNPQPEVPDSDSEKEITPPSEKHHDPEKMAKNIAKEFNVDLSIAWAALGATSFSEKNSKRSYNEAAARKMVQLELEMIDQVKEDSIEVQQLVSEGYDVFLSRRALAFAELNVDDARAILQADQQDEQKEVAEERSKVEEESKMKEKKNVEAGFKTVNVKANFDPTTIGVDATPPPIIPAAVNQKPKDAARESVVFEATTAQIQELVIESPVPVLLDIYADWCGPCKALSPILEEMAVKSGGSLRLVKVNSDNERAISSTLQVTGLPTVFGVRDGKILHMFQGMPRSEEMMKNFLMGLLIPGQAFKPPVTEAEQKNYDDMSVKLLKVACTAAYPFSARERLGELICDKLDDLVNEASGDVLVAEEAAKTMRTLLNNVIRNPYNVKFRSINLENKVIAEKVAKYKNCIAVLKGVGFMKGKASEKKTMSIGQGKKIVNIAPLLVTREAIDKWIEKTRYEVGKAARKRKDELERQRLQEEASKNPPPEDDSEEVKPQVDPNLCVLKVRVEGKNKLHELNLDADDTLFTVLERMRNLPKDEDSILQITCVAKKLVVTSKDAATMTKSLRELKLLPTASLVIAEITSKTEKSKESLPSTKLSARAANKKKRKTGSHTMQSIGIYAKDDNAKGELIDGGGGTLYEHDVTDDEEDNNKTNDDFKQENENGDEIQHTSEFPEGEDDLDQYDEARVEGDEEE